MVFLIVCVRWLGAEGHSASGIDTDSAPEHAGAATYAGTTGLHSCVAWSVTHCLLARPAVRPASGPVGVVYSPRFCLGSARGPSLPGHASLGSLDPHLAVHSLSNVTEMTL